MYPKLRIYWRVLLRRDGMKYLLNCEDMNSTEIAFKQTLPFEFSNFLGCLPFSVLLLKLTLENDNWIVSLKLKPASPIHFWVWCWHLLITYQENVKSEHHSGADEFAQYSAAKVSSMLYKFLLNHNVNSILIRPIININLWTESRWSKRNPSILWHNCRLSLLAQRDSKLLYKDILQMIVIIVLLWYYSPYVSC